MLEQLPHLKVRKWLKIYLNKMIRRRRIHRKKAAALALLAFGCLTIYCLYEWKVLCSNGPIYSAIDTLCSHFANGKAHGNLCRQFCVTRALQPESCQTFHVGKEVVFSAFIEESQKVFVKGRRMDFMAHPEEALHWGSEVFPSKSDFEAMVRSYLVNNMGIKLTKDANLMESLWFPDQSADQTHPDMANWQRANVWSLLQDNEYVLSKLYASVDIFPTLLGSCGGLYVVEALEPLSFPPRYFAKLSFNQWAQRVSVTLAILDLLDELENVFEDPVHLCDVKPEHFGISDFGKVKVLDLDSVFLKSHLDKTMVQNHSLPCSTHSDCDFFDCKGQCDLIKGRCTNGVVNNNLQVVCEKILLSRASFSKGLLTYPGLLSSKHLNKRLKSLLERCANPSGSREGIRLAAPEEIRIELYKALREVMDIARQVDHSEEDLKQLDRDI